MRAVAVAVLALCMTLPARADTDDRPPSHAEEKELAELLSIVQQETDVATRTRMNSDYVPGIVTVLEGDDLEALGLSTAGEALGLVPGMYPVRDDRGSSAVIVRGIDFPFNSGNILILINSVPLTRQDSGTNSTALLMPVEQIERIEVIRGPGSVVYGDYAFMGLVNIVTRKQAIRVFARGEVPRNAFEDGARVAWKAGASSFAANLARYTSDEADLNTTVRHGRDERWFGAASWELGGLSVSAQTARRSLETTNNGLSLDDTSSSVEGKYARDLMPKLHGEARVTYVKNDINDFLTHFRGDLTKVSATGVYDGFRAQSILFGADYAISTIDMATHRLPPPPGQPPGAPQTLAHGLRRKITGLTLQDSVDLGKRWSVTLGGRYDSYSDFQSRITPRAAIVWRVSDRHIVKAQYAEGFRPPTFFELYQTPAPGSTPRYAFEVNATTELNYVYRSANRTGRATVFHSVISNMIRPGGVLTDPNARANGAEVEWSQQLLPALKIDANVSYVDTIDPRVTGPGYPRLSNVVSPDWLANVSAFYHAGRSLFGGRWNHVGERVGGPGYDTLDLTVSRENLFLDGLQGRIGIRNAFNDDVRYFSLRPNGDVPTLNYPGRTIWLQLSWKR